MYLSSDSEVYIYIYFKETFKIMMYLLSNSEVYCTGSRLSKLSNLYIFKLYYNYYLYILKSILEVNFLNLCICIYVQTQNYTKIIYTWSKLLKLVSGIFYQIFIFLPNEPFKNYEKCFLFHLKSTFRSQDIQIFVIFPLPFHTFQIQKDKWNLNNLLCHELTCINLQV